MKKTTSTQMDRRSFLQATALAGGGDAADAREHVGRGTAAEGAGVEWNKRGIGEGTADG